MMHYSFFKRGSARFREQSGFTLVELIVAMGLFLTVMAIATGAFVQALRTQRQLSGLLTAENNVSILLEQIAREIRTGTSFCGGVICPSSTELSFTNAQGQAVTYRLDGTSLMRGVGGAFSPLTGTDVVVQSLRFVVAGQVTGDGWSPRVTIVLGISSSDPNSQSIVRYFQTTVSSRLVDG